MKICKIIKFEWLKKMFLHRSNNKNTRKGHRTYGAALGVGGK